MATDNFIRLLFAYYFMVFVLFLILMQLPGLTHGKFAQLIKKQYICRQF